MRSLPPLATGDRVFGAVLVIGCGIAQAAALAVAAFATRDAFAALHAGAPLELRTMAALGVSGALAAACLFLARCRAEALGQSYASDLRRVLFEAVARLPKSRHEERRVGALSLRFVGDLSAARLWYGRGFPDVITAMVVLPGAIAILVALDPSLAGIGMIPLGAAFVVAAGLAWHLDARHRRLRSRRASIAISMIERIAIAPELDLMGRTDKELRNLDAQSVALRATAVSRRGRTAGLQAVLQTGVALSGLAMLWLAGGQGTAPATVAASLSVLALVALPLQDLAAAWDRFCAWQVARGKAERLLREPVIQRRPASETGPVTVTLDGWIGEERVSFRAEAGAVARLVGPYAGQIARIIAGLDARDTMRVTFGGSTRRPRVAHIGDTHIGLQGSLRRAATLSASKRPGDARITAVLRAFGLDELLQHPRGLDQKLSENGKGLTAAQSLRLDLARAVLGEAGVIVVASLRWVSAPDTQALLSVLRDQTTATIILADATCTSDPATDMKAE